MKTFFGTVMIMFAFAFSAHGSDDATAAIRYLPVQDGGRIKPFDTFARETLQLVYGSQTYKTKNEERRPATEIVMTWMLVPQYWDTQKMIEISHRGLKEALGLDLMEKFFTPSELFSNERMGLVMQELVAFRESKQKLTPFFQSAQRLESQLGFYQSIKQGTTIRVAPPKPGGANDKWLAISELEGDLQAKFATLTRSFIQALPNSQPTQHGGAAAVLKDGSELNKSVEDFKAAARAENPEVYPSEKIINIEVHYKETHPFMISWILYLLAALVMAVAWQSDKKSFYKASWAITIIAFLIHTYGFCLRMYLTGRPPVSNMYESVIWVSWGTIVFAFIFEYLNPRKFILIAGAVVGTLCLIVADLAPTILDRSLQPLEPVLRSNLWLTVHVLTITLSYSAFFLAWGLANIGLGFVIRGEKSTSERLKVLAQSIYRSIQIGVVLLAAGTILGGVWADYSWGRFWGWDPKETWALIALLGYLAVLHGRLVGWVKNFAMLVCAVVAFNLVIMAWYGVNFVLGAGLHSYGFGAGGVQYVGAFVILNLIYAGYADYIRRNGETAEQVRG